MIDEKKLINYLKNISKKEKDEWEKHDNEQSFGAMRVCDHIINYINHQLINGEWIPCSERLPENAKYKRAFCPTYQLTTKYGVTEGWYNPGRESWYILAWFLSENFEESNINLEKGDIPKCLQVPAGTVIAWKPKPEPWEGAEEWNYEK